MSFGGFGRPASTTTNAFGSTSNTNAFGSAANTPAASPFGAPAAAPNAFGASTPSAFGGANTTTTGFGNTASPFGAAAAPVGNTGGFGATATSAFGSNNTTTTSAFGATPAAGSAFGATPAGGATPFGSSATPAFGASGGFGATTTTNASPFGATTGATQPGGAFGAFGSNKSGGGAFGATSATAAPSAFGSSGGSTVFGGGGTATQPNAFGSASTFGGGGGGGSAFGATAAAATTTSIGTGNPSYRTTDDPERPGSGTKFISICHMPAYAKKSPEELRYEDYLKKSDPAAAQALMAASAATPSAFGGPSATAGSAFGAPAATTSAFGATATNTFGSTTTNAFGATTPAASPFGAAATPSSAFGATPAAASPFGATAGGGFGAAPPSNAFGAPATSSAFGATANSSTPSAFGAAPQSTSGFSFGGGAATTTSTTPSAFGATATTPATTGGFGGFGATTPASTGFGATTTGAFGATPAAAPATGGFGGFGATASSGFGATTSTGFSAAATPSSGFGFGTSSTTTPATSAAGFSFGSKPATSAAAAAPATPGGFGGFGTPAAATPSGFGTPASTSLFGGTTTSTTTGAAATPSAFGTTATATPGFSFGGPAAATPAATPVAGGTSLFSSTPSAFGANTSTSTPSLFGKASGGLFGGGGATTPSAFGARFGGGATPNLGFQSSATAPPAQAMYANPNVNAYGAGNVGAGLLSQQVEATLALKIPEKKSENIGVGLPRESVAITPSSYRYTPSGSSRARVGGTRGLGTSAMKLLSSAKKKKNSENNIILSPEIFKSKPTKSLVISATEQKSKTVLSRAKKDDGGGSLAVSYRFLDYEDDIISHNFKNGVVSTLDEFKKAVAAKYRGSTSDDDTQQRPVVLRNGKAIKTDAEFASAISPTEDETEVLLDVLMLSSSDKDSLSATTSPFSKNNTLSATKKNLSATKNNSILSATSSSPLPPQSLSYEEFYGSSKNNALVLSSDDSGNVALNVNAPRLTRPRYYTIPDVAELERMTDDELRRVEDFTVGCEGFGYVTWDGVTDVRNLELDEIVEFQEKEIIVYPDDDTKPDVGFELNKPALVQLEGIFPPATKKKKTNYASRIEKKTKEIGAVFEAYDQENGIWRFRTLHFSRYGLDDSDDSDDDENQSENAVAADKKKSLSVADKKKSWYLPHQLGMDPKALHALARSYNGSKKPSDDSVPPPRSKYFNPPSSSSMMIEPEKKKDLASHPPPITSSNALLPVPRISRKLSPAYLRSFNNSSSASCSKNSIDMSVMMGRSFRVSWGPNNEIVHSGRAVASEDSSFGDCQRVLIERPFAITSMQQTTVSHLKVHLNSASEVLSATEASSYVPQELPQFKLPLCSDVKMVTCIHEYIKASSNANEKTNELVLSTFSLVNALFGQETNLSEDTSPAPVFDSGRLGDTLEDMEGKDRRRAGIAQWFEETIKRRGSVKGRLAGSSHTSALDEIMEHLSRRDLRAACAVAVKANDLLLATLLSQAQSFVDDNFRLYLQKQLSDWNNTGVASCIEPEMLAIYKVLAGDDVASAIKHNILSHDWIASLGMIYWYTTGPSAKLGPALDLLLKDEIHDIRYALLNLYSEKCVSLSATLETSVASNDVTQVDFAWHLYSILKSYDYGSNDKVFESKLVSSVIFELESCGLWHWATYVALTLPTVAERRATVESIVSRHASEFDDNLKDFVTRVLHVPSSVIESSLATYASYVNDPTTEISNLIAASMWQEAHVAVVTKLAPSCIFSGDHDVLREILQAIEVSSSLVGGWLSHGGVYLEYIRLCDNESDLHENPQEVLQRVEALSATLSNNWTSLLSDYLKKDAIALERIVISSMVANLTKKAFELRRALSFDNVVVPDCLENCRSDYFGEANRSLLFHSSLSQFVEWTNNNDSL